ncbi:MAG: UvrD-helicase domain-containing protein [Anaerolineae bacterium]|nr:UvrD-helicase domain-containing protein [Anaerolineae bacterium]
MRINNALDFDDLLMQTVLLLRNNATVLAEQQARFQYVMVDEFQDTNMAQYELVRLLARKERNLFVVGDPDQSIYAFRGADYRNVRRFQEDFPELSLVPLEENYRSHQLILDAAMAVIRKDPAHIKRELFSQRRNGPVIEVHELHTDSKEAEFVITRLARLREDEGYLLRDFAVMYRTNAQSPRPGRCFCGGPTSPYQIVGGVRFYERIEIKDLVAYLRLIFNPDDSISLARVLNTPGRGIGKKSEEMLFRWIAETGLGQWGALGRLLHGDTGPFAARPYKALHGFATLLEKWVGLSLLDETTPQGLLETIIEDIDYRAYIEDRSKTADEAQDRKDNITELRSILGTYEGFTLGEVLEKISLVADVDSLEDDVDAVTLLTLHAAKGLEFPVVFLAGMEEGLLPHERSTQNATQIAEERRLAYVGITRAKDRLYLTHATIRGGIYGADYSEPSRFLDDLPEEIIKRHSPWIAQRNARRQQISRAQTTWSVPAQAEAPHCRPAGTHLQDRRAGHPQGLWARHRDFFPVGRYRRSGGEVRGGGRQAAERGLPERGLVRCGAACSHDAAVGFVDGLHAGCGIGRVAQVGVMLASLLAIGGSYCLIIRLGINF